MILKKARPDLRIHSFDALPTGLVCITNLDPDSTVLEDNYFDLVDEFSDKGKDAENFDRFYNSLNIRSASEIATPDLMGLFFLVMNRGDSFVSTDDQVPTKQPSLKTVRDLALQGADSLEAVARRADSIFWEKVEETIHGEVTVFNVDGDGSFQESVAGVAFAPYPRFYAGLSDVFYHP